MVIDSSTQRGREQQRGARREFPGGQWATLGARHLRVDALVEHVIDDRGAGGGEADAEIAERPARPRWHPGTASSVPTMDVNTMSMTTRGFVSS
jgi:hypothetical protein